MKTITFYSYKGGVGRSLALVNIASRLAEFNKKVCLLDFDLEAPGLHLKFHKNNNILSKRKGLVDYIYEFANRGLIPDNLLEYFLPIPNKHQQINLIPAGDVDSEEYWKKLSAIDWYDLAFENTNGLAFFLKLKEDIQKTFNPDFLLIDSRTGISEMSGITLSLLADEVVIVSANNRENLTGARRIIRSLSNIDNSILNGPPKISFVLSRIPFTESAQDRLKEQQLVMRIKREYLLPAVNEISIIHSDRELEEDEKVKIAYDLDESTSQTSIDYLRLFEKLTKNDLTPDEITRFKNIRNAEQLAVQASGDIPNVKKLELINRAIELNKGNADFYLFRSKLHYVIGDVEKAKDDLAKALQLQPDNYNALALNIDMLFNLGDYRNALTEIDAILSRRPQDVFALSRKIAVLTKTNALGEAESVATEMINAHPEIAAGYAQRGNVRRVKADFDAALEDIYKALEIDSENLQAIATLAEIYAAQGKRHDFYLHFENVLKKDLNYALDTIYTEDIYKLFLEDERFLNLLSRYGIILDETNFNN